MSTITNASTVDSSVEKLTIKTKSPRGFAAMKDRDRLREIARSGGKAAHAMGKAHRWNTEEAIAAGRKGGVATRENRNKNERPTVPTLG